MLVRCDGGSPAALRPQVTRRMGLAMGTACVSLQLLQPGCNPFPFGTTPVAAAAEGASELGPVSHLLHIVLKVGDVRAAADYYQAVGMSVVRERPGNIFVGYGPETPPGDRMVIELAQGKEDAVVGTGMDHLLISLDDPRKAYRAAVAAGGTPVKVYGGRTDAVRGPDGVNLVFTNGGDGIADPLCRLVLNVDKLEPTRLFMQGVGMKFFESRSDSVTGRKSVVMGYGRGPRTAASVEIVSPPRGKSDPVVLGDVFGRFAVSSTDLDASVAKVQQSIRLAKEANVAYGSVLREPFAVPRIGTRIAEVADPTGYVYALVNTDDFMKEFEQA